MTTPQGQAPTDTNTASGAAITQVLAYLDGLSDDAAAHIYPSDLEKCMTSECVVEVASVRAGNGYERTVPLFSREQVVDALASAPAQPVAEPAQVSAVESHTAVAAIAAGAVYAELPMQFACSGVFPVYSADQMRAFADGTHALRTKSEASREFLERMLSAMEGVIDVADRKTAEFDALRSCVVDLTLMLFKPEAHRASSGQAPAGATPERQYISPVSTVADLVNNLMLMDQSLPIYGAQYIEHAGRRRCIAVDPTVSRERVKDSRWIGEGDDLNAAVIWTRATQPDAGVLEDAARLDWLEEVINTDGAIHLHDGQNAYGLGLGLRPGHMARTLREAIDAARKQGGA